MVLKHGKLCSLNCKKKYVTRCKEWRWWWKGNNELWRRGACISGAKEVMCCVALVVYAGMCMELEKYGNNDSPKHSQQRSLFKQLCVVVVVCGTLLCDFECVRQGNSLQATMLLSLFCLTLYRLSWMWTQNEHSKVVAFRFRKECLSFFRGNWIVFFFILQFLGSWTKHGKKSIKNFSNLFSVDG